VDRTRYAHRVEEYRLPKSKAEREQYANQVGADGWHLLDALEESATPTWLRELPTVQMLRRVWAQQYHPREPRTARRLSGTPSESDEEHQAEAGDRLHSGHWRAKDDLPPAAQMQNSPYDAEARYGKKRETSWVGYKLHLTETCEADAPHLIVHVATTPACASDETALTPIHQGLAAHDRLPRRQFVDAGYVDADVLATNQAQFGVEVFGPTRGNFRWQARAQTGFEGHHFTIDWEARHAICPEGRTSQSWTRNYDRRHAQPREMITIRFSATDCRPCPSRARGTLAPPRAITVHPRAQEVALRAARTREQTDRAIRDRLRGAGRRRGDACPRAAGVWAPSLTLYRPSEDPFAARPERKRHQFDPHRRLAQRHAPCTDPPVTICPTHGSSCLTILPSALRHQYQQLASTISLPVVTSGWPRPYWLRGRIWRIKSSASRPA
jgi:Transposase DDE domain